MDSSNPVTPFLYNCVLCFFSVWQGLLHGKMLEKKQKISIFCTVFGIRLFCPSPAPGALLTGGILKVFSEHPTPRFGIQFTSMVLKSGQTIFFKYFFPHTRARSLASPSPTPLAPRPKPKARPRPTPKTGPKPKALRQRRFFLQIHIFGIQHHMVCTGAMLIFE